MNYLQDTTHGKRIIKYIKDDKLTDRELGRKLRKYYQKHKSILDYPNPLKQP